MISRIMQSIAPAPSHHNQVHLPPPAPFLFPHLGNPVCNQGISNGQADMFRQQDMSADNGIVESLSHPGSM